MTFSWDHLTPDHKGLAGRILGRWRDPDLIIAPEGTDYLYRWILVKEWEASVYFHIQVASDSDRGLHTHPADNTSIILAGAYYELLCDCEDPPTDKNTIKYYRKAGDYIPREAKWSHRLIIPDDEPGVPYAMTLFMFGERRNEWGFWIDGQHVHHDLVSETVDGVARLRQFEAMA